MGVLPLRFVDGQNAEKLGLDGSELIDIEGLSDADLKAMIPVMRALKK
jgi:aconitate hydratase